MTEGGRVRFERDTKGEQGYSTPFETELLLTWKVSRHVSFLRSQHFFLYVVQHEVISCRGVSPKRDAGFFYLRNKIQFGGNIVDDD